MHFTQLFLSGKPADARWRRPADGFYSKQGAKRGCRELSIRDKKALPTANSHTFTRGRAVSTKIQAPPELRSGNGY
ncbi:hypothetical protein CLOLEP_00409 [[Clostridium] leptum DSM 753]|uniref:Uncharacterized protein n=1 Tax=[Clostridium] leptum DSM 753 TaxID=428125 RepID=A7VPD3_9FIRM|nr:hypothetical protein CLOLEP_00409 [[Clostridium] leptum DSM 753]PEQ24380.1 hypothetical protein CH238_09290 [[Clostridium] leptum DSM 753]